MDLRVLDLRVRRAFGITITADAQARRVYATACAWLPALIAMTPRLRSAP